MKNNLYITKGTSGVNRLLIVLLFCFTGLWSTSSSAVTITSTNLGGLWKSPQTWVGGAVPSAFSDVVIADGATVTIDSVIPVGRVRNVTIGQGTSGILQFSFAGTANPTINIGGDLLISPNAKFHTHLNATGTNLLILRIGGNFTNNGYANMSLCVLEARGALQTQGFVTSNTIIGGSGYWVCDSTPGPAYGKAIIRNLRGASSTDFGAVPANANPGDVYISPSISQPIVVPATFSATSGNTVNTADKVTIYNGAMLHGLALNREVSYVAVTNMGSGYASAPVVGPSGSANWAAGAVATGAVRVNGTNVYVCLIGGASTVAPTFGVGSSTLADGILWLFVGNTGTVGIPFGSTATLAPVLGAQYYYENNLYTCTATGVVTAANAQAPPTHTSGALFLPGGGAEFLYVGSPAKVSVNWDATSQTVRSLNLTDKGAGYIIGGSNVAMAILNTGAGTGALATAVVIQSTNGAVAQQTTRAQGVIINGTLDIHSNQSVSRIVIANGGLYNTAPQVGVALPFGYRNLVTNGGSGYLDAVVSVSGGVKLAGGTDPSLSAVIAQGKIVSIIGTGAGAGWQVPPNIVITSNTGSGALAAYPSGCLATATANLTDRSITSFNVTAVGNDYTAAPAVLLVGAAVVAPGATTARIGTYNLLTGYFGGAPVDGFEGPEIPVNRRISSMTQQSIPYYFSGDIEVYGAAFGFNSGYIDMGGNDLNFTNPFYAGNFGNADSYLKNGSVTLSSPGGNVLRAFPFNGISVSTGGNSLATNSTITRLRALSGGIPTGAVDVGIIAGMKSFKLVKLNASEAYGSAVGAEPVVTLQYAAQDGLETDSANLFIAHSPSRTGPWTVKSLSIGLPGGNLGATGNRVTSQTLPITFSGNDFFTWAETAAPYPGVDYQVTRSVAQAYSSIMPAALGGNSTGQTFVWEPPFDTDDGISTIIAIPSSTFQYHGETVTGFRGVTNGYMILATSNNPSTIDFFNDWESSLPASINRNVVAPFMDDLTSNPDNNSTQTLDSSMRYFISPDAPGSRTITIEWYRMTLFGLAGPELYFQVILNEIGNTIKFNYGNMQCYNGTHDIRWTYLAGMSGRFVQPDPKAGQTLIQQFENTAQFSCVNGAGTNSGANGLSISPDPRSSILFTPGITAPVLPPVPAAPGNDNFGGALPLDALLAFPTNIAWNNTTNSSNLFTTRYATHSNSNPICGGSPTAKDVWFTFEAVTPTMQVRIYGSGGFIPRVEVLDGSNLPPTALTPVQCVKGLQGFTASASMTGLTIGNLYYVRVYHDTTGTTATATAVIVDGQVTAVNVTTGGSKYTQAGDGQVVTPRISFSGGGGESASANILLTGGSVSDIIVTNGGRNYTTAPAVTIESPDFGITGEFGIIVFAQAENDDCGVAIPLTNLSNVGCVTGQNSRINVVTNAANLSLEAACTGTPDDDVWYKFLAPNSDSTTITVSGFSGFDPVIEIFDGGTSGGNCATKAALSPAVCSNVTSSNGTETPIIKTTAGNTYFIRVYHAGVGSGGVGAKFDICISSAPPVCLATPVSPAIGGNSCTFTLLKWNAAVGATRYNVVVDGNTVATNLSDTTYNAGVLSAGAHTWKIIPINASGAATGCADWTFTAVVQPTISISPNPANGAYCGTGSVTLTASGAGNYTWSPATDINTTVGTSVIVSPPAIAGLYQSDYVYTVIGYSVIGCPDTATRTVTVNRIPPAPITTGFSQCLNGAFISGAGLVANCKQEVLTTTIQFTPVTIVTNTNEGISCPPVNHIIGTFTLPALPAGASYLSAKVLIEDIRQFCSGSFGTEIELHFSGPGISGTSGCYPGSQLQSQNQFIDYTTGDALNRAGDTAIVAALLNPAGGLVTIRYRESFDDCPTVPDYIFPGDGSITLRYTAPVNTVKWYDGANALVHTGTPYNPQINTPAGNYSFNARCVTLQNCESVNAPATLVVGSALSVAVSHTATSVICANTADTLKSTVTGGGEPYHYSWSDGATVVSTNASFIATPSATTTYTLTVTHSCVPTGSGSVTTNVNAAPPVTATQTGKICSGVGTVVLNASGADTYTWSPAAGLSATNLASVSATPGVTTTYTVIGKITATGCSSPFSITATNNPNITMTVSATPSTLCEDSTSQLASTARFDSIPSGYCVPFQSTTGIGACIDTISFNTLLIKSNSCSGTYYQDVSPSVATTTLIPGNTYAFHASFFGQAASTVWIDYNRSGIFATFEGRQISSYDSSATIMITIPTDAVPGYTKMRVRSRLLGQINTVGTPCGTFPESGSTVDFVVRIGSAPTYNGVFSYLWTANGELSNTGIANPTAIPATVGLRNYVLKVTEVSGCEKTDSVEVNALLCLSSATVKIKAFIQGYYIGAGQMTPTLYNEGIVGATDAMVDTVTIEAHDATTFALVDSYTAVMDTGGNVTGLMFNASINTPYYFTVRHRNALFTSSANPLLMTAVTDYDFTLTPLSAFGNNEVATVDGRYAIYSGDVNNDEYIDTGDVTPVDNDNLSGLYTPGGYWLSDVNGDGYVDTGDVTPTDNNNLAGILSLHP